MLFRYFTVSKQIGIAAFFVLFVWLLTVCPGSWIDRSEYYLKNALTQEFKAADLDWSFWGDKIKTEWEHLNRALQ